MLYLVHVVHFPFLLVGKSRFQKTNSVEFINWVLFFKGGSISVCQLQSIKSLIGIPQINKQMDANKQNKQHNH